MFYSSKLRLFFIPFMAKMRLEPGIPSKGDVEGKDHLSLWVNRVQAETLELSGNNLSGRLLLRLLRRLLC